MVPWSAAWLARTAVAGLLALLAAAVVAAPAAGSGMMCTTYADDQGRILDRCAGVEMEGQLAFVGGGIAAGVAVFLTAYRVSGRWLH